MNYTEENLLEEDNQPLVYIIHVTMYAAIFLIGILGNALVIYTVLSIPKMQTVTNIYILNLAIADVCFLLGVPFLIVTMIKKYWVFGPIMCKAYMATTSINQFTTSLFMLVISGDRFIAVCYPNYNTKLRTSRVAKVISLLAWVVSILLMIPIFMHTTEIVNHSGRKSCVINWWGNIDLSTFTLTNNDYNNSLLVNDNITVDNATSGGIYSKQLEYWVKQGENLEFAFIMYTFALSFAFPVSLVAIFYGMILKTMLSITCKDKSKEMGQSRKRVTRMVLVVIAVYVVCWLPYWVMQWLIVFRETAISRFIVIYLFVTWLSYSNSAINPILYGVLSHNFRKSFLKAYIKAERPLLERRKTNTDLDNNGDKFEIHSSSNKKEDQHHLAFATSKTINTSISNSDDSLNCGDYLNCDGYVNQQKNNISMETTSL